MTWLSKDPFAILELIFSRFERLWVGTTFPKPTWLHIDTFTKSVLIRLLAETWPFLFRWSHEHLLDLNIWTFRRRVVVGRGSRNRSKSVALSESTINRLSAETWPFLFRWSREHLLELDMCILRRRVGRGGRGSRNRSKSVALSESIIKRLSAETWPFLFRWSHEHLT